MTTATRTGTNAWTCFWAGLAICAVLAVIVWVIG